MRDKADLALKGIGMNLSDAVRFMAARIIEDKQLPFEVLRGSFSARACSPP